MASAPRVFRGPCFFLFVGTAFSQPLFFLGRAESRLEGAFSYDFLKSPLDYPARGGEVEADFNVPVDLAGSAHHWLGNASDSTVVMPAIFGRVRQLLNAGISAAGKAGPGTLFFAARENAGLRATASLGDAVFNLDTALGIGTVRLKGGVFLPLLLDLRWRSLSLGYVFRPAPWLRLGLQVHRHEVLAVAGGDLRPDIAGRVETSGVAFDVGYSADQVYGSADGDYRGVAYGPEMAVAAGPLRWTARLPVSLRAEGRLDMEYRVPFFIDAETLEAKITRADSFLTPDNLRRLLAGETDARSWVFREPLRFSLPGSHTLAVRMWKERLELSYTRMFGALGVHSQPARNDTDSAVVRSRGALDAAARPDHLLLFRWETPYFRGCLGFNTVNFSYRGNDDLLSGLSPLEWDGDPIAPVIQFGFIWGAPLRFHLDLALTPLPALRSGMGYRF